MIGRWRETPNSVYLYIPIMENIETADFADAINRELYSRSVQIRNYLHHAEGTKH